MRQVDIPLHELAFVAITRGLAGAGIGLLVSEYIKPEARRAVGWTLLTLGALTTVPIAASLISKAKPRLLSD